MNLGTSAKHHVVVAASKVRKAAEIIVMSMFYRP
jgi:hypothetical protein